MGLTGGIETHRLSDKISPYWEKKGHWLCAHCVPMFHFCRRRRRGRSLSLLRVARPLNNALLL